VGTLDALYSQLGGSTGGSPTEAATEFDLKQALLDALLTIPKNLHDVADNALDPLGLNIGNVNDLNAAATEQEVKTATFAAMQKSFDGKAGAFAYLLFILLYAPCVTATAAIYRETNMAWTIFVVCWTTGLAYLTATVFYQMMTYDQHPKYSLIWINGLLMAFVLVWLGLWIAGRNTDKNPRQEMLK
jgi:ferrous iron transport protein B